MALNTLQSIYDNRLRYSVPYIKNAGGTAFGAFAPVDYWEIGGTPTAAEISNTTAGGVALTTSNTDGYRIALPDGTGDIKIASIRLRHSTNTLFMLYDRLWECGAKSDGTSIDVTSQATQTINSVQWPARDDDGTSNGKGVYIALFVDAGVNTFPDFTVNYTNSDGTSGRTGTRANSPGTQIGDGSFMLLQAGDFGVRSVESITFPTTTATSGAIALVAYRPILLFETHYPTKQAVVDPLSCPLPPIPAGAVLSIMHHQQTNSNAVNWSAGQIVFAQG